MNFIVRIFADFFYLHNTVLVYEAAVERGMLKENRKQLQLAIRGKFLTNREFGSTVGCSELRVSQVVHGRTKLTEFEADKWLGVLECDPNLINAVRR